MNTRIAKVIATLGLKKVEFARQLKLSAPYISELCSGKTRPSDRTIADICQKFNVSDTWLRTGKGEMFLPKADTALELLVTEHGLTGGDRVLIEKFLSLKAEDRRTLVDYARKVAAALVDQDAAPSLSETPASVPDASGQERTEPDIAAELAELKRQNQKLAARMAAMEEEDALQETSLTSPSVSVGKFSPAEKAKI